MTDKFVYDDNFLIPNNNFDEIVQVGDVDDGFVFGTDILEYRVEEDESIQEVDVDEFESVVKQQRSLQELFTIEPLSKAERLAMYPEMQQLKPFRRRNAAYEKLPTAPLRNPNETNILRPRTVVPTGQRAMELALASSEKSDNVMCGPCGFLFRSEAALLSHEKLHRNGTEPRHIPNFLCPIGCCSVRCDCQATLNEHVRAHHGRADVAEVAFYFDNYADFERWKDELEDSTASKFIRSSGKYSFSGKTTRYSCFFTCPQGVQRRNNVVVRQRTSRKNERACTSYFVVKETFGQISVRACLVHMGHDIQPHLVPMSMTIRREIATALVQGETEDEIVQRFRNNSTPMDRRHFIQPYEVRNIYHKLLKSQCGIDVEKFADSAQEMVEPSSEIIDETSERSTSPKSPEKQKTVAPSFVTEEEVI